MDARLSPKLKTQHEILQEKQFIQRILHRHSRKALRLFHNKVTSADIPLVYINREPDEEEQKRWKDEGLKVTYVGADARQSGTYQGELILETETKGDINGDGVVSYIMIEGDPENVDAQYRTEYSVKALTDAGTKVKELDDEVANWDQAQAQEKVQNALSKYPEGRSCKGSKNCRRDRKSVV